MTFTLQGQFIYVRLRSVLVTEMIVAVHHRVLYVTFNTEGYKWYKRFTSFTAALFNGEVNNIGILKHSSNDS